MAGSDGGRSFLDDLKRRQVVRVAVVYIGAGFVVLEGADLLGGAFQLPQVFLTAVGVLVVLGFPLAVALAWAFEITPEGVKRTEEALHPPEPSDRQASEVSESPSWISLQTTVVAISLVLVGIFLAWGFRHLPDAVDAAVETPSAARRLAITLPESSRLAFIGEASLGFGRTALDLSPDGRLLVYAGATGSGGTQLYLRPLDRFEVRPLAGTEGAYAPFFSPDSRWIGFFAEDQLKKVSVLGGKPIALADAANPIGGTWWNRDRILFAANEGWRLFWVSASGGEPNELEMRFEGPKAGRGLLIRSAPQLLPGERHFLFSDHWHGSCVYSFESGVAAPILPGTTSPRYVADGTLLFTRGSDLMAVAFDPEQLEVVSDPILVAEGVRVEGFGAAQFAVAGTGLLAFAPGAHALEGSLAIVSLHGHVETLPFPKGIFGPMGFSPGGELVAVGLLEATWDIWIYDLQSGTRKRMTREGNNAAPVWSSDGERIYFGSDRGKSASYDIYWIPVREARAPTVLVADPGDLWAEGIAKDGTLLISGYGRKRDLYLFPSVQGKGLAPFAERPGVVEGLAHLSPDDQWVAYTSDETGRYEVYVESTGGKGSRVRVTAEGGEEPVWSPSGDRIFFRRGTTLMAVPIQVQGSSIAVGEARSQFDDPAWINLAGYSYQITPDGSGFLIVRSEQELTTSEIRVVEGPLASPGSSPR
jgi:serine/threonine-protein kinase